MQSSLTVMRIRYTCIFQVWPWTLADQGIHVAYWKESFTGLEQFLVSHIRYSHQQKMSCLQTTVKLIATIWVPLHLMRKYPRTWVCLSATGAEHRATEQRLGWLEEAICQLHSSQSRGRDQILISNGGSWQCNLWGWNVGGFWLTPSCCQSAWQYKQKPTTQDFNLHAFFSLKNMRNFESGVPLWSRKGGSVYLVLL